MKRRRPASSTSNEDNKDFKKAKLLSGKVPKGSSEHRCERRRYLAQLLHEFQTTSAMECKQQILANLANFGYDPYNYPFFLELGIIPVFLAELTVYRNEALTEFAMAGICNCVADKRIQTEILKNDKDLSILKQHISSSSTQTLISLIAALITFSIGHSHIKPSIKSPEFSSNLSNLLVHEDKRVRNVVQVLLDEIT